MTVRLPLFPTVLAVGIFVAACTSTERERVETSASMQVPVMTVVGEGADEVGALQTVPLKMERSGGEPLKIAIADDEPGGTGSAFSGAAWSAAIAAGFALDDPLDGVKFTLEMKGGIDGPSAGAMMCLAMMSTLEGRTLPGDFGMTGSIAPDGTIGAVGGVAEKIKSAAEKGLRRFAIPASVRYEDRDEKGEKPPEYTDLFSLGASLGVEVKPVRTIAEARAFAFGEKLAKGPEADETVAEITGEPAEVFKKVFIDGETARRAATAGKREKRSLKKILAPDEDVKDEVAQFARWGEDADSAYCDGFISVAAAKAVVAAVGRSLKDFSANEVEELCGKYPVFAKSGALSSEDRGKFVEALRDMAKEKPGNDDDPLSGRGGYLPDNENITPIAAQLEGQVRILCAAVARNVELAATMPSGEEIDACGKPDLDVENAAAADELLRTVLTNEVALLASAQCYAKRLELEPLLRVPLALAMGDSKTPKRAREAGRFFYVAWKAVWEDVRTDLLAELAKETDGSEDVVIAELARKDGNFAFTQLMLTMSGEDQALTESEELRHGIPDIDYHDCAVAVKQAESLALAFAVKVLYAKEDADYTARLAERLRKAALREMAACEKAGVQCLISKMHFALARYASGGDAPDMFCVVSRYAAAVFTARSLRWTFSD